MKVPNFRRPTNGDYPDVDEQSMEALKVLGRQLEIVTQALQSNITPEDNGNVEVRTVGLKNNEAQEIKLSVIKGAPQEVSLVTHERFDYARLAWETVDIDKIRVAVSWDSELAEPTGQVIQTKIMIRGAPDG